MRGIIYGLLTAAPVGPIGVLCIRRTLALGRGHGFVSGLGAATADGIYGFLAVFGLSVVNNLLVNAQGGLQLIGGLFLLYLGCKTMTAQPAEKAAEASSSLAGLLGSYLSTFFLTLTNPLTILAFAAIFASVTVEADDCLIWMAIGVPIGSILWWGALSLGVGLVRERFSARALLWVNRSSGLLIVLFGFASLLALFI